jgi:hypothetical protein
MTRQLKASIGGIALVLAMAWPSSAGARVNWVCDVPGEGTVVFVSAADAARHGLDTANAHAGQTFNRNFGEVCTVVQG